MKKILIFIGIFILINNVSASVLIAQTSSNNQSNIINITGYANNISSEFIEIIPKETLENASTISSIRFWCGYDFTSGLPNHNLEIRFFKYIGFGTYSPIDNTYLTPSQCQDSYAYNVNWILFNEETIDHNYDYAVGFYSNGVTVSGWEFPMILESHISNYSDYNIAWVNVSDGLFTTPIINESILDINGLDYSINGDNIRHVSTLQIYGSLTIPPTPTPTPTGTPNNLGTPLNNSTNLNDLNNLSNNPNALNQIQIGLNTTETVGSIANKINASALGYTVFGFMIFIIRFFSIKKGVY